MEERSTISSSSDANNKSKENRNNGEKNPSTKSGGDGGKSGNSNEGVAGFLAGDRFKFEVIGEDGEAKLKVTINPGAFSADLESASIAQPPLAEVKKVVDGTTITVPTNRIQGSWDFPTDRTAPYAQTFDLMNKSDPIIIVAGRENPLIVSASLPSRGFDVFGTYASTYGSTGGWMTPRSNFSATLFSSGGSHSFFWKHSEGKLYATGNNNRNQLGIEAQGNNHVLVPVLDNTRDGTNLNPHNNPVKVQAGTSSSQNLTTHFSGILLATGDLLTFGNFGQGGYNGIGQSDGGHGLSRVLAPASVQFIDFTLGEISSCAISTEYRVYCWGGNSFQSTFLGWSYKTVPTESAFSSNGGRAKAISGRYLDTCLIDINDSQVYCVGQNFGYSLTKQVLNSGGPVNFKYVDTGRKHFCALGEDDFVYCAGGNGEHQVDGVTLQTRAFVKVPISTDSDLKVADLSVGPYHNCVLTYTQEIYCWGNENGEEDSNGMEMIRNMGGETTKLDTSPFGGAEIFDIEVGSAALSVCAHTSNGYFCVGNNYSSQLGITNEGGNQDVLIDFTLLPNVD